MSQVAYTMADEARAALRAAQNALIYRVKHRVIEGVTLASLRAPALPHPVDRGYFWSADRATAYYNDYLAELMAKAKREIRPDETVRIQCSFCKREYRVAQDVREFECSCDTRRQSAFLSRI